MSKEHLTVYYDAACPLCRREIDFYRGRAEAVSFQDINAAPDTAFGPDLDREAAVKRFHVRKSDGQLVSGAAAFAHLWMQTPSFRWVGAIVTRQPFRSIAELAYRMFLKVRPLMQSAARKTLGD